ncbi:hypothetical protein [Pseudomonas quasicaspiana]|uniref:hypothetical protein n=1 Tax=Pseudomonas quasicaspiana TaxID=2829821 RepID=UPI001E2847CE|nr:hypothetical protein [Pseudomonas quasicaspiana]MCD5972067.1 hypothetical protein [Pseudomonas quasicaspiana]
MSKYVLMVAGLLVASCTFPSGSNQQAPHQKLHPNLAQIGLGELVQRQLTERYNDTRANCGAATQPAFLCSGILIRATDYSPNYHVWDNSLESHRKGGVSFAYIRKDSKFPSIVAGTLSRDGYLLSPAFYAYGKLAPQVLCSFPLNAGTRLRDGTGCGAYTDLPVSRPCQEQGITSADEWFSHYRANGLDSRYQCGFDVKIALDIDATTAFKATLEAMALLQATSLPFTNNELRLAVWPDGQGNNLSLQAFYYDAQHQDTSRPSAQNNQLDFKNTTGLSVPIIAIVFPENPAQDFTFSYLPGDQIVDIP